MSVFGIIVSGRLVQTDFQPVDVNKSLVTIENADSINHIVVFLTGVLPLPPDTAASVYFSWPDPNSPPKWQYLGYISNCKPSAIFRINKLRPNTEQTSITNGHEMNGSLVLAPAGFDYLQPIIPHFAQIGISVEPISQVEQLSADITVDPLRYDGFARFATKMAENLFNYTSSFAQTLLPNSNEQYVPLSSINQWYQNFIRKFQANPNFWKE